MVAALVTMVSLTPSLRSEYIAVVQDLSMWGQEICEPRGMLSHTMAACASSRYPSRALRRSSSFGDQAAAAGRIPVTAYNIMMIVVVLPPPRRPAVTQNAG